MFLFPTALVTCLFFLAICAIIDLAINVAIYLITRFQLFGGIMGFGAWFIWILFGGVWCLSFYLASRVQHLIWRARLPPNLHR